MTSKERKETFDIIVARTTINERVRSCRTWERLCAVLAEMHEQYSANMKEKNGK